MFPNVRLLIVALLASVVTLSCAFAVFATFRVNHEPLARIPTAAAPLQLIAANDTAPAGGKIAWGAPFGSSLPEGDTPSGRTDVAAVPATSPAALPQPGTLAPPPMALETTASIAAPPGAAQMTPAALSASAPETTGSTGAPASEPQGPAQDADRAGIPPELRPGAANGKLAEPPVAAPAVATASAPAEQAPPLTPPAVSSPAPVVAAVEPAAPISNAELTAKSGSTEPAAHPVDATASSASRPQRAPNPVRLVRKAGKPKHIAAKSTPPRRRAVARIARSNFDTPDHPVFQSAPAPQRMASVRRTIHSRTTTSGPVGSEDR